MRLRASAASVLFASGVVACHTGSGTATESLKVGDCYDNYSATDANGDPINGYQTVSCGQAHVGEIFSVFDYPNASGWPGYEAIGAVEQTRCQADFQSYVGIPWEQSGYTINYAGPGETGWASGNHTIKCRLEDATAGKLTGSARGSKK